MEGRKRLDSGKAMKKDKITITITLERNINGTVSSSKNIEGEGFHIFELIGLIQIYSYELAEMSRMTADQMEPDKTAKLIYKSDI